MQLTINSSHLNFKVTFCYFEIVDGLMSNAINLEIRVVVTP